MTHPAASFPIDSSAILYLAQMGPDHTNVYRFTMAMDVPIDPEILQKAANNIYARFPTIFAGFLPGTFSYSMVPAKNAPKVQPDPGLLHVMSPDEIHSCAYRIYYTSCHIIIEAFHALTDGYGAIASIKALVGEYIYLRHGISLPEREALWETPPAWEEELRDVYPDHTGSKSCSLPHRYAYQLERKDFSSQVYTSVLQVSTQALRDTAKRNGVSMTTLLSVLMAEAIAEIQEDSGKSQKQVRIMVPIDLRNQFPCKTLRNFILYALPTLDPGDASLPRKERFLRFQSQLRSQIEKPFLQGQITRNVTIQRNPLFRILPLSWKCGLMRLSYRFFGESNSSITLTNLGPAALSEGMRKHLQEIQVHLMPRRTSPYNCGLLSCGDVTSISITRFGAEDVLAPRFFKKLQEIM